MLVIFVDDDESKWNQNEINKYWQDQIVLTKKFFENQAKKYNINLNIDYGYYCTNQQFKIKYDGIIVKDLMKEKVSKDIFNQVIKCLGFKSKTAFHEYIKTYSNKEQIIYIFAINKDGRSYAMPDFCANEDDHLEYCVTFPRYLGRNENEYNGSLVHEILHLFGAEDYYDPYNKYPKRKELAKILCQKDFMLVVYNDINANEINRYTAYSIGWLDELPIEYDNKNWWE